ncbi:uncharacterized protein TRUGW13939_11943 [Talaromyces rugulosus]|uniref:Uncharacterized protein n=1 Tax=Talaromyces rugulosus TaxID=121627 RepID=A0A7H8RF86_TALRU|nr:uncharacterized protein TRUGW13939_11943 [Talaromyces rugulosus]QKX64767.1 hypothetical protein TRUGW13939_11943 [Talaromyces rugulosus]
MADSRAISSLQHHMLDGKNGAGAVSESKKERKRLQNRLNQRARRLRIHQTKLSNEKRPFHIDRWRLEESHASSEYDDNLYNHTTLSELSAENTVQRKKIMVDVSRTYFLSHHDGLEYRDKTYEIVPTLPADHLLTLIQFNVLRALRATKDVLWQSALYSIPELAPNAEISEDTLFSRAVITHASKSLPSSLAPVQSQTSFLHFVWVDIFPFPTMRENFITWEKQFNHVELVNDLVGNLVDTTPIPGSFSTVHVHPIPCNLNLVNAVDDEVTTSRNGLIVWGEPHLVDSWEATPGFLRKWGWAVQGCHDLIESSNRWRVRRGEEPFRISTW